MRHRQARLVDRLVPVDQEVEVDDARAPPSFPGAFTSQVALDCQEAFEQLPRSELRGQLRGCVQELRLVRDADRVGLPERGGPYRPQLFEALERSAKVQFPVAEVRPETHENARRRDFVFHRHKPWEHVPFGATLAWFTGGRTLCW